MIIAYLTVFALLAQALDLATFYIMIREHGITREMNPLVVWAYESAPALPLLGKLGLMWYITWFSQRAPRKLAALVLVFAFVIGLVGGVSNLASL